MKYLFLLAFFPSIALAQAPTSVPSSTAEGCSAARFRLEGADFATDAELAVFKESWVPVLEFVAACLSRPEHLGSCVQVQGQWDEVQFNKRVTDILGSQESAQSVRAQSRSRRVASSLHELGVKPEQVREMPPPTKATWRGAEVMIVPNCVIRKEKIEALVQSSVAKEVVIQVDKRVDERVDRNADEVVDRFERVISSTVDKTPKRQHHLYGGAALGFSTGFSAPSQNISGVLQLSLAYATDPIHISLALDTGVGSLPEQRAHVGAHLAAHYIFRPWMQVGLGGGAKFGALGPIYPWYEALWSVGFDTLHTVYRFGDRTDLSITTFLGPLGGRIRRAEYDAQQALLRIPESTSFLFRFDLGLMIRRDFL